MIPIISPSNSQYIGVVCGSDWSNLMLDNIWMLNISIYTLQY